MSDAFTGEQTEKLINSLNGILVNQEGKYLVGIGSDDFKPSIKHKADELSSRLT